MGIDSTIYVMRECGDRGWFTEAMMELPRGLSLAIMGKYEYLDIPAGTKIYIPVDHVSGLSRAAQWETVEAIGPYIVGDKHHDLGENWSCTTVSSLREAMRKHSAEWDDDDEKVGYDYAALAMLDKLWPDLKVLFHWC